MFHAMLFGSGRSSSGIGTLEPDGLRAAAGAIGGDASGDSGEAEIVADHLDPGGADVADDLLDGFELGVPPRTVEQDVAPVQRIEILDGEEFQPVSRHRGPQRRQLLHGPDPAIGEAPA